MKSLLRLAVLINLVHLSTGLVGLGSFTSRILRPLNNSSSSDDENQSASSSSSAERKDNANAFESIVRKVSGNDEYKFGDLSKSVISSSTKGVEGVVKSVTKNEDYEFGDYTKTALGATTSGFENVVRSVIKNEEYRFGDLTRGTVSKVRSSTEGILTYSEKTLSLMREANIHEAVQLLNYFWSHNMNFEERKEAFTVIVYLGAIMVLSYSFIANMMQAMVFGAAWFKVAAVSGMSPLASPQMWTNFMHTRSKLDFVFGGPFLPVRVAATIPWFFQYRKFVVRMAYISPLRKNFPILNRVASLLVSWVANLASLGGFTYLLVKLASIKAGIISPTMQDLISFPSALL